MERALLCELHAHTTWSDGELGLRELVDLAYLVPFRAEEVVEPAAAA